MSSHSRIPAVVALLLAVAGSLLPTAVAHATDPATYSGVVTDRHTRSPLAGVTVGAYECRSQRYVPQCAWSWIGSTTTGSDGRYTLTFPTTSSYKLAVRAEKDSYDVSTSWVDKTATAPVTFSPALDLSDHEPITVTGRITDGDYPARGVEILASPAEVPPTYDPEVGGTISTDFTDEEGRYSIEVDTDSWYDAHGAIKLSGVKEGDGSNRHLFDATIPGGGFGGPVVHDVALTPPSTPWGVSITMAGRTASVAYQVVPGSAALWVAQATCTNGRNTLTGIEIPVPGDPIEVMLKPGPTYTCRVRVTDGIAWNAAANESAWTEWSAPSAPVRATGSP